MGERSMPNIAQSRTFRESLSEDLSFSYSGDNCRTSRMQESGKEEVKLLEMSLLQYQKSLGELVFAKF